VAAQRIIHAHLKMCVCGARCICTHLLQRLAYLCWSRQEQHVQSLAVLLFLWQRHSLDCTTLVRVGDTNGRRVRLRTAILLCSIRMQTLAFLLVTTL
jgi:hypothetical protein